MINSSTARRGIARLVASAAIAVVGLGAGTAVVMAYPTPGPSGTLAAGCSNVQQGATCDYTFQFGGPGQPVAFGVSGVAGASVSPVTASTDVNGRATTTLRTGSGCGTATVSATSGGSTVQTTVRIACTSGGIPLPNTSTAAPSFPAPWVLPLAAVAVIVLVGGAFTLRQTRRTA